MISLAAITFDVDWAPDWATEECRTACARLGMPATFFATHASGALDALLADRRLEVGIHPNFMPGSSHGSGFGPVLDHCLGFAPAARSMRTHGLVQSSALFAEIADRYPQIQTDVSLFLPGHPDLRPIELCPGASGRRIVRLPFYWEDDVAAARPDTDWTAPPPPSSGLRIFDFHPALVALNIADYRKYVHLKEALRGRSLTVATREDFAPFVHSSHGARTYLERIVREIGADRFVTISEITATYLRGA